AAWPQGRRCAAWRHGHAAVGARHADTVAHRQRRSPPHGDRALAVLLALAAAPDGAMGTMRPRAGPLSGRGRLGGFGRSQPAHFRTAGSRRSRWPVTIIL